MKKNILIIILAILTLGLGSYLGYDRFIVGDKKCADIVTQEENKEDVKEETTEERFKRYTASIKKEYDEAAVKLGEPQGEDYNTYSLVKKSFDFVSSTDHFTFYAWLDKNYSLHITTGQDSKVLGENVFDFWQVNYGNGGFSYIVYSTFEGDTYYIKTETIGLREPEVLKANLKYIVRTDTIRIPEGQGDNVKRVLFDIDGNSYTSKDF